LAWPIAATEHGHDVGAIEHAIQEAFGQDRVGEEGVEIGGGAIRGQDERAPPVAATDEFI
jgi:hypothetical protein